MNQIKLTLHMPPILSNMPTSYQREAQQKKMNFKVFYNNISSVSFFEKLTKFDNDFSALQRNLFCGLNKDSQVGRCLSELFVTRAIFGGEQVRSHVNTVCVCVSVLSSHLFWTSGLWTYQPGSLCGACINLSREKDSAVPFPRRP